MWVEILIMCSLVIDKSELFKTKTQEMIEEREEVLSKPHLLEKFAREKYLMKKKTEEVYIIEEKNK